MNILASVLLLLVPALTLAEPKVNDPFPSFVLKRLDSPKNLSNGDLKGKVVVIDFWASWCTPCKKEMPALNALFRKYEKKGLIIVGVNEDDEEKAAKKFLKTQSVRFPLVHDTAQSGKKLAENCGLAVMPTSFVLDRGGVIRHIHQGYREGDEKNLDQEIRTLLEKQ